jgi:hypothetical protein
MFSFEMVKFKDFGNGRIVMGDLPNLKMKRVLKVVSL